MSGQSTYLYVPRDTSALALGADEVANALFLAAEKKGVQVKIIRNGSRGLFWLEPLVEVVTSRGRVAYGPVTLDDVDSLFEANFLKAGNHPLFLGKTEEIRELKNQERLTFARCGVIDPLDLSDYQGYSGLKGLKRALEMTAEEIVSEVTRSGLRGRGGAGFPTGIKWKTVLEAENPEKFIACNADEGDSGTFSDRMIMEGDPFSLLEGMIIAGLAVGAETGFIYLRSEYPLAHKILDEAVAILLAEGLLGKDVGGSGRKFEIKIRLGAGSYICGEETAMLESLEGKRGIIRYKPPLPAHVGLFGKPTVVNNVISLASIPFILADGGEAYGAYGAERSRGTLPFQLAGNIKKGGLVEKAFGLTLRDLIEGFGGGTRSGRPVRAVQVGGPLGAYFPESLLDTAMDYEVFSSLGGLLGHGGIVVFDDTVDMAQQARFAMEFCALESCGKCTPCRIGSTRGVEVIDRIIKDQDREKNRGLLDDLCELMEDASLCALGGLTPLPVRSALKYFPEDFEK